MSPVAETFLRLLDPHARAFTYQTAEDLPTGVRVTKPELSRVINTDNPEGLRSLNTQGAAIWVTVNRTNLKGRKAADIVGVRAVWQEDDDGFAGALPLAPSMIVESSPNKFHRYWLSDWPADEQGRADHGSVMARMVESYGSCKGAKDISRVLRVPGFFHRKGEPHLVRIVDAPGHRYSRTEILEAFPPIPRISRPITCISSNSDSSEIASALAAIPADDRDVWLEIGMALHSHGGNGRRLWDQWSATSAKYNELGQERAWRSFKRSGITIRTLFFHALRAGWQPLPEKDEWSAAGYLIRHNEPRAAFEAFMVWCARNSQLGRERCEQIFGKIIDKEMMS